jgi:hypothetical protein
MEKIENPEFFKESLEKYLPEYAKEKKYTDFERDYGIYSYVDKQSTYKGKTPVVLADNSEVVKDNSNVEFVIIDMNRVDKYNGKR